MSDEEKNTEDITNSDLEENDFLYFFNSINTDTLTDTLMSNNNNNSDITNRITNNAFDNLLESLLENDIRSISNILDEARIIREPIYGDFINSTPSLPLRNVRTYSYEPVYRQIFTSGRRLPRYNFDHLSFMYGGSGISNMFDEVLDNVLTSSIENIINESFNEQPTLEKTNDAMDLESYKYNTIVRDDKDKGCCVCLVEFEDDSNVSVIECNHIFHTECIKEWTSYKKSCPVCRKNLE